MSEPEVSVQAIVDALVGRIATLELEVAVLKSALQARREASQEDDDDDSEPGNYL